MKILCVRCEEPMRFEGAEDSGGNAARLAFVCQKCGSSIAMLANEKEGELIRSMGIPVSERNIFHKSISWDKEAEAKLSNVPPFAREMAKAGIERYASDKGYTRVTLEVMAEAKTVFGMS